MYASQTNHFYSALARSNDGTHTDTRLHGLSQDVRFATGTSTAASSSNNNNNDYENVSGAVIMSKVIARVHQVHLMNAD